MASERDIGLWLRLDELASRICAAESLLRELRNDHDRLLAEQRAELDLDGDPHPDGDWLGHDVVERAIAALRHDES
ncbi:MAG: hypothetical protein JO222_11165 [Frankiales bacterium]|nr:hypothetical protein [Frankiales bacterium]